MVNKRERKQDEYWTECMDAFYDFTSDDVSSGEIEEMVGKLYYAPMTTWEKPTAQEIAICLNIALRSEEEEERSPSFEQLANVRKSIRSLESREKYQGSYPFSQQCRIHVKDCEMVMKLEMSSRRAFNFSFKLYKKDVYFGCGKFDESRTMFLFGEQAVDIVETEGVAVLTQIHHFYEIAHGRLLYREQYHKAGRIKEAGYEERLADLRSEEQKLEEIIAKASRSETLK